ncbi:MAG: adenosylcobinamide-phosphate synthase CbiB [Patescibacteria group bacterium]
MHLVDLPILTILAAYLLDLAVGDPPRWPHPVRLIGWAIARTERILRALIGSETRGRERKEEVAGLVLVAFIVSLAFGLVFLILAAARQVHPVAFHLLNIYFLYSALACRCLADEARKVYHALQRHALGEARVLAGMLVGRDTQNLEEKEIIRAVVETTAENTVDGVIAPLFYIFLGSLCGLAAPLVYVYKAANTLDSMVGYMNERYRHLGRAAAKLDDVLNYLPARLSGVLIPLAAFCRGKGFRRSFQTMLRDRRKHASPNSAYPEAAVAGALGVRLGGTNIYFGRPVEKPTIGEALKELEPRDIPDTAGIMFTASLLALAGGVGFLFGLV